MEQRLHLAGLQIDGEEDDREARGEAAVHHLVLEHGLDVGGALDLRVGGFGGGAFGGFGGGFLAGEVFAGGAFGVGAGGKSLVGVDGGDGDARGQVDELADCAGGNVGGVDGGGLGRGIGAREEDAGRLAADDDEVGGRGNDEPRGAGGEVDDVDALGGHVDHELAVGREGVDVEVGRAGVGLVGEAVDAVASVLVDPGFWRILDGRGGRRLDDDGAGRIVRGVGRVLRVEGADEEKDCEDGVETHGSTSAKGEVHSTRFQVRGSRFEGQMRGFFAALGMTIFWGLSYVRGSSVMRRWSVGAR